MTPLILAALLLWPVPPLGATLGSGTLYRVPVASVTQTALPSTGWATYYSPGVFERVLKVRGIAEDACPDCDGWAAMLHAGDLGRVVCVEGLRLLVVDVAAGHHRAGLIAKGWVIDLQWEVWQALGFPNAPTLTTVSECSSWRSRSFCVKIRRKMCARLGAVIRGRNDKYDSLSLKDAKEAAQAQFVGFGPRWQRQSSGWTATA